MEVSSLRRMMNNLGVIRRQKSGSGKSDQINIDDAVGFTDFQWVTFHLDEKSACRTDDLESLLPSHGQTGSSSSQPSKPSKEWMMLVNLRV